MRGIKTSGTIRAWMAVALAVAILPLPMSGTALAFAAPVAVTGAPLEATDASMTILAVGDIMAHVGQLNAARRRGTYGFTESFAPVKPAIEAADLAVGNLETTLSKTRFTGYPAFKSPTAFADAIKWAGFDALTTANNHSLDGGAKGVRFTTAYLDSIGMAHFGTNNTAPVIVEHDGIRIAFASYTYSTNGIRSPFPGAVNRIGLARMRGDIQAVRPTVDLVIVFMHWGREYSTSVEKTTRSQARYLVDSGADMVLGSHPHVVRPVETYNGHYIVYSMGNFLSGQSQRLTDLGAMVTVKATKTAEGTTISDLRVRPTFRDRSSGKGRKTYRTVLIKEKLAAPDRLISKADKVKMRSYLAFSRRMYGAFCE
jgi:poly-gamma-glutamate capsule biosynthesis protein CapA/YwtB (metallophosphatase superfamily)